MAYKISGTEVINDSRKGIFASMNVTAYAGQANYPTEVSEGDIIFDSAIDELVIFDGVKWSVQSPTDEWAATGGETWSHTQTMPNGVDTYMKYHRFLYSGTLNCPSPNTVEFVLVGGGGGGGCGRNMGGGGAGGIVAGSGTVSAGSNTITIGQGGDRWNAWGGTSGHLHLPPGHGDNTHGGNTTAGGLTAYGGGSTAHPVSWPNPGQYDGGSGAGGPSHQTNRRGGGYGHPSPTQQGYPGGYGSNNWPINVAEIYFTGGGGGGADAAGESLPASTADIAEGGMGIPHSKFHVLNGSNSAPLYPGVKWQIPSSQGIGLHVQIKSGPLPNGLPTTSPEREDRWFGGGGGGGQGRHTGSGAGSALLGPWYAGGGGGGGRGTNGAPGQDGAGGGGGSGGFYITTNYEGGDGGHGVVYVRYSTSDAKTYGSGGTESTHSLWRVHTFTSPGTFDLESVKNGADGALTVVIIGGGGGGGADGGGGGGGGGVLQHVLPAASILPGRGSSIPITVGSGGGGGDATQNNPTEGIGSDGGDSVFGACGTNTAKTAFGGGGGGANAMSGSLTNPGRDGASGGGGGGGWRNSSLGGDSDLGANNTGQGSPGYDGYYTYDTLFLGGGGGGAGPGAGGPGSSVPGGYGLGIANLPTSVGTPGPDSNLRYFGGGGGGMRFTNNTNSSGGYGGGGAGGSRTPQIQGTPGTANTGGGGGGSTYGTTGGPVGKGGSGIVIIKYLI